MQFVSAPAGQHYANLYAAGKDLLRRECPGYLAQDSSGILPCFFANKHPELVDAHGNVVPASPAVASTGVFQGLNTNKRGKVAEQMFFHAIHEASSSRKDMLVLNSLAIMPSKCRAVVQENTSVTVPMEDFFTEHAIPLINLTQPDANEPQIGETDFLVYFRDTGVGIVEVKDQEDHQKMKTKRSKNTKKGI